MDDRIQYYKNERKQINLMRQLMVNIYGYDNIGIQLIYVLLIQTTMTQKEVSLMDNYN